MAVGLHGLPVLHPVPGIRLGTASAGIRKKDRSDLVVIECAPGTQVVATFTQNRFCAAPVIVAREHLAASAPRALLINTGFANAGTGGPGIEAAGTDGEATAVAAEVCSLAFHAESDEGNLISTLLFGDGGACQ